MRLGVETPLSRGVLRKDSVARCWRRTFGTWQVLRGVQGCVLPAEVPPAVVIAGTGRHVARVCWKGEMVLEESLTVLAELDAEHMQRQYGSHGSFPIAHAPETDCAKVKSGDRSVIFQPLVGHAVALAPKVEGARRCAGGLDYFLSGFLVLQFVSPPRTLLVQTLYRDLTVSSDSEFTVFSASARQGAEARRRGGRGGWAQIANMSIITPERRKAMAEKYSMHQRAAAARRNITLMPGLSQETAPELTEGATVTSLLDAEQESLREEAAQRAQRFREDAERRTKSGASSGDSSAIDADGSGDISIRKEFVQAADFAAIDADASGDISINDLRASMKKEDPAVTEAQVQKQWGELDCNRDGSVSRKEFVQNAEEAEDGEEARRAQEQKAYMEQKAQMDQFRVRKGSSGDIRESILKFELLDAQNESPVTRERDLSPAVAHAPDREGRKTMAEGEDVRCEAQKQQLLGTGAEALGGAGPPGRKTMTEDEDVRREVKLLQAEVQSLKSQMESLLQHQHTASTPKASTPTGAAGPFKSVSMVDKPRRTSAPLRHAQTLHSIAHVSSNKEIRVHRRRIGFRVVFAKDTIDPLPDCYVKITAGQTKVKTPIAKGGAGVAVFDFVGSLEVAEGVNDLVVELRKFLVGSSMKDVGSRLIGQVTMSVSRLHTLDISHGGSTPEELLHSETFVDEVDYPLSRSSYVCEYAHTHTYLCMARAHTGRLPALSERRRADFRRNPHAACAGDHQHHPQASAGVRGHVECGQRAAR